MKTIVESSAEISSMLNGTRSEREIVAFFQEHADKEITAAELAGAVLAVRTACIPIDLPADALDTCGTGGSGKKTINTSTLSAFIVAAAGGKVAKHGNRSASGNCGCFDLLDGIGATIDLTVDEERRIFDRLGIVFLYARTHHPAIKHVAAARKKFGKPTIFNLIGPLANPANIRRQMIGTPTSEKAVLIAETLTLLGTESSLIVTGRDGLDEVTVCADSEIFRIPEGTRTTFSPADLGIETKSEDSITGGTTAENTEIFRALAAGGGTPAHRNLALLNAAFALTLTPLAHTVEEGLTLARETLTSGNVHALIERYVSLTNNAR